MILNSGELFHEKLPPMSTRRAIHAPLVSVFFSPWLCNKVRKRKKKKRGERTREREKKRYGNDLSIGLMYVRHFCAKSYVQFSFRSASIRALLAAAKLDLFYFASHVSPMPARYSIRFTVLLAFLLSSCLLRQRASLLTFNPTRARCTSRNVSMELSR